MTISKRILILDGNSSHCLPIIRSLEKSGHRVTLICPSVFSCGYFSKYGSEKKIWPRITTDEEEFYQLLIQLIKVEKYDLILGFSDQSSKLLSSNKAEIEKYSGVIVPDFKIFKIAVDKFLTMKFCMENEIPCPITFDAETERLNELIEELKFPVVLKPKVGVGAVGFFIISDKSELKDRLPRLNDEYGPMLIQEFLPNEEQFTVEAFCDSNSDLKACVIAKKSRFFPINGGTSSCNVTVHQPVIVNIVRKLLKNIQWVGSANVDIILDHRDNTPKVIEINPRVGSIVKIAFLAGIDLAAMTIDLSEKRPIENKLQFFEGIVMRNLMLDLLWFFFSPFNLKLKTKPAFFKFLGRNLHYQNFSLDDPLPMVGYILGNMLKYANLNVLIRKLRLD